MLQRPMLLATLCAGLFPASSHAATIQQVFTHSSFETLGFIVQLSESDGNERVRLRYRENGQTNYQDGHPLVRFDGSSFAGSLFYLKPGTPYQVEILLEDPDGVGGENPRRLQVSSRAPLSLPTAQRTLYVGPNGSDQPSSGSMASPFATIGFAGRQAQAGDEIRVLPGNYPSADLSGVSGTESAPIVFKAHDSQNRPVIDGNGQGRALNLYQVSHLVIDGFEIHNGGSFETGIGVRLHSSARVILRNNYIHDNGRYNVLVSKNAMFPGGILEGGYHIIENNRISDEEFTPCGGRSNSACPNQTTYGIRVDNNPGAAHIVRGNEPYGHVDNIVLCGDEGAGRDLPESANVLALTGGRWTNHNSEVYDNHAYDAKDDNLELDGICVNARVFRNRFGSAENSVSAAPAIPGPYFFIHNYVYGDWGQAAFKLNTAGNSAIPIRNVYAYHNTFMRSSEGTLLNLWYAIPGDHNVPIKNILFLNNIFSAPSGGRCIDVSNRGREQVSLEYNLWWTTSSADNLFEWWDGAQTRRYRDFVSFQQESQQEMHGLFADPLLDSSGLPDAMSPAIDRAVLIPGINHQYSGRGPDQGAYEYQMTTPQPDAGMVDMSTTANSDMGSPQPDMGTQAGADVPYPVDEAGVQPIPDAGMIAPKADAGSIDQGEKSSDCRCYENRTEQPSWLLLGLVLGLIVIRRRKLSGFYSEY